MLPSIFWHYMGVDKLSKVQIHLINFQSHKNTEFTLDGDLQIIWSKGNNVGKSAIFSSLDAIVRIHKYNGQKIKSLIRYGENFSKIICKYQEITVELHMFLQNDTAAYFFICEENGFQTKMERAPKSLIEALDILYQEDIDHVLNILEADKIQIIVDETSITDGILASIFFDAKLEDIKTNAAALVKKLSEDYSFYSYSLTINERNISNFSYNMAVDTFKDEKEKLYILAKLLDRVPDYNKMLSILPIRSDKVSSWIKALNSVSSLNNMVQELSSIKQVTNFDSNLITLFLNIAKLDTMLDSICSFSEISRVEQVYYGCSNLCELIIKVKKLRNNLQLLDDNTSEIRKITDDLKKSNRLVSCPIKGKVIFNNEKCIPYIE